MQQKTKPQSQSAGHRSVVITPVLRKGSKYPAATVETATNVFNAIAAAPQPITAGELIVALRSSGHGYSGLTMMDVIRHLEKLGAISSRKETDAERRLRFKDVNGIPGAQRGGRVKFYWVPDTLGDSPTRTRFSIVPGTDLFTGPRSLTSVMHSTRTRKKTRPGKAAKVQTGRPGMAAPEVQTGRIVRLERRVAELEQTIARLTKALS